MSDKKCCFRFTRDEIDNLFFLVDETLSTDEVRQDDEEKQIWAKIRDQLLATGGGRESISCVVIESLMLCR